MLLSIVTFLPLLFALAIFLTPRESWIRPTALVFAVTEFVISLWILAGFNPASSALQLAVQIPWIPELGISYFLGVDGLSLWLVLLTTFLLPVIILGGWNSTHKRVKGFHAALFFFQTSLVGSFLAMDAILFYVFFELALIPAFLIVGIWGGNRRVYATTKFFLFTMAGSLMMLLAIIYLMMSARDTLGEMTSNLLALYQLNIPFVAGEILNPQTLLFAAFALAFAIKVPLVPLHTWQPDTYSEAPAAGTALLAGVMSKLGVYGFLRFVIPLFPEAVEYYSWFFLALGALGVVYGALLAMVQPNMKRLIAYSSISHMGFMVMGVFALNDYGVSGSLFLMLSHGVTTVLLFLMLGMLNERTQTLETSSYGGLAKALPLFTILFFIATLANIGLPLTNGFVGEFLVLMGAFQDNQAFAWVAVTGVILSSVYMLWMIQKVFFGEAHGVVKSDGSRLLDLKVREMLALAPLAALIFWMGVFPNHFLNWSKASIAHLVSTKDNYKLVEISTEKSPVALQVVPGRS